MYHHIAVPAPDEQLKNNFVDPAVFEAQLKYLKAQGYETITLSEMNRAFLGAFPLPEKPVILTFDDAYADFYANAYPLLKKYQAKANLSVITGMIGGDHLTWEQILEVSGKNVEIVSHTQNHLDLSSASAETVRSELSTSRDELIKQVGNVPRFLVYPSGKYSDDVIAVAKELGYLGALTTEWGKEISTRYYFEIPRVRVSRDSNIGSLLQ
jgi:peptidoglycan/xylan/chitin deacetylase (PgdA/CDA1 family)